MTEEERIKLMERMKNSRPKSHLETYQSELCEYMQSKFAKYGVPNSEIMEAAQYCYSATLLVSADEVRRYIRSETKRKRRGDLKNGNQKDR